MFYYCSTLCTLFKVLWSTDACCNLRRSVSTLHLEYTTNCSAPLLFIFACAIHELPRFIRVPLRSPIFLCRGWCTSPITSISIINRNLHQRMYLDLIDNNRSTYLIVVFGVSLTFPCLAWLQTSGVPMSCLGAVHLGQRFFFFFLLWELEKLIFFFFPFGGGKHSSCWWLRGAPNLRVRPGNQKL